jgi:hypothetical protein
MLFNGWHGTDGAFDVLVAPTNELNVEGAIKELVEIHMIQAARLFRENNELVQVVFTGTGTTREVLARNVVGLQFAFDPESRLLTMYVAARGQEPNPVGVQNQPFAWPDWLGPIDTGDARFRVVVKNLTWRIRN